ncbi:ankyrin repeat domain-containing protein [Chitinimonas lacunae]|uniref:Ankyrin repeat domain-containing protein n=1 Tax=Chitinimonas lacunae TaxID=1963018 RepID=A0ABV8MU95_9NEIS
MSKETAKKIYQAIEEGDAATVGETLRRQPQLLTTHINGESWLHIAARKNQVSIIEWLVTAGLPIDIENQSSGETPLDSAAGHGSLEAARWLISRGADVNRGAGVRATPLINAIYGGSLDIVQLLVSKGARLDVGFGSPSRSPASFARDQGQDEIADWLLANGSAAGDYAKTLHQHLKAAYPDIHRLEQSRLPLWLATVGDRRAIMSVGLAGRVAANRDEMAHLVELLMYLPGHWLPDPTGAWALALFDWLAAVLPLGPLQPDEGCLVLSSEDPKLPRLPDTPFQGVLLVRDNSDAGWCDISDEISAAYYLIFPLFAEEVRMAKDRGVDELLDALNARGIEPVARLDRASAV